MPVNDGHDAVSTVLARLRNVQPKQAGGWEALCPAHDDERRSLSVGQGNDGVILLRCHRGCSVQNIVDALGLNLRDLFPSRNGQSSFNIVTSYDYTDESGQLLYQVCRLEPKDFRQRRPGPNGSWTWKLNRVQRVLYHLPELLAAPADMPVWIVEGEKDVETLREHELLATTNAGGAGKWRPEYNDVLRSRTIIILPDNDDAGRKHARDIAMSLRGVAASVTILDLPDLPPKGDVTDWFNGGGTASRLYELLENAKNNDANSANDADLLPSNGDCELASSDESDSAPQDVPLNMCGRQQHLRVEIDAGNKDLATVTPEAIRALVESNDPLRLFRHAGPARMERDERNAPFVRSLTRERMRYELARAARWLRAKTVGGELVMVDACPPNPVVEDVLATPQLPFPILVRVVEAPTFAVDGTLHDQAGYNAASRAFYEPASRFALPSIPESPTPEQIKDAVDLLKEPMSEFPFVSDADRAHAIAASMLPFVRDMIEGPTPLHSFEAPSPGTGKTLLVGAITYPALGRAVTAMTEGRNEDEWRKRVFAKLRGGPSVLLLDNLRNRIDSLALSSAITAYPDWEDRILGVSETARVPVRSAWLATTNNPGFSNELARRTVRIRIDPKQDQPWLRDGFAHPNLIE